MKGRVRFQTIEILLPKKFQSDKDLIEKKKQNRVGAVAVHIDDYISRLGFRFRLHF